MSEYYITNKEIGSIYCNGCTFMEVHCLDPKYKIEHCDITIVYGWFGHNLKEHYYDALLMKDLDDSLQTILTLVDPMFRKVSVHEMSYTLKTNIGLPEHVWKKYNEQILSV